MCTLISIVLSVLVIVACGDKDESVQNTELGKVHIVDTPVPASKQLSPQPSPVGNHVLVETLSIRSHDNFFAIDSGI